MNELIIIGKTVSTFGIKGELKVISDFEYKTKAYQINKQILINNVWHTITGVRYHKNYVLLAIDNLSNINDILQYVGFNIYMSKQDLHLLANEYLYSDLIGASVIDEGDEIGKVIDVIKTNTHPLLKVSGTKIFYIPLIPKYVSKFLPEAKNIFTKNGKDLIL